MPKLVPLPTHSKGDGLLTVFENVLPTGIKRVFYVYGVGATAQRAKHGHKKSWNALTCVSGSCRIYVVNKNGEVYFELTTPSECLILEPGDWHTMDNFSADAVLVVASTEHYDKDDYFFERP